MQQLYRATSPPTALSCAEDVMGAIPPVVWFMRRRMRSNRGRLTLSQFRSLVRVEREDSVSVTEVADHVGTSLSTTSRVVGGLVRRGFLARNSSKLDRRRVNVRITDKGRQILQSARKVTRRDLEKVLAELNELERVRVVEAMQILRRLFQDADRNGTLPNGRPAKNSNRLPLHTSTRKAG